MGLARVNLLDNGGNKRLPRFTRRHYSHEVALLAGEAVQFPDDDPVEVAIRQASQHPFELGTFDLRLVGGDVNILKHVGHFPVALLGETSAILQLPGGCSLRTVGVNRDAGVHSHADGLGFSLSSHGLNGDIPNAYAAEGEGWFVLSGARG